MSEQLQQARRQAPTTANRGAIRVLAAAGVAGPVVFAGTTVVLGLLRPGSSFVADPLVALVFGPGGWVQRANLMVVGLLVRPDRRCSR
ncbi:MAG: hypothetical protein L0H64_16010 [Pseudonocardia sp.]|nr:hypothetical protein [Pseudonocardia sp.]